MNADRDSEPRQRSPERRTIEVKDIDLDGFLVAAEAATSMATLTEAFRLCVAKAGFHRAQYFQLVSNFERVPLSRGERLKVGDDAPDLAPSKLTYFDPDPAMTTKLAQLRAYTWLDMMRETTLNAELTERVEQYKHAGFTDGVTVPVSLHEGDIAAFVFLRKHAVFSLTNAAMTKLQFFCQTMHARAAALAPSGGESKLSKREHEVMTLVAIGRTNADIAVELGISVHTVNTLVRRCFLKLGGSKRPRASPISPAGSDSRPPATESRRSRVPPLQIRLGAAVDLARRRKVGPLAEEGSWRRTLKPPLRSADLAWALAPENAPRSAGTRACPWRGKRRRRPPSP